MSVLALCLWASLVAPERDPDVVRGETAYREKRWSDASEAFAAAYERTGDPTYLYTQAQAERRGGRCDLAIGLYERFLATRPADVAAATARGYVAQCREEIGEAKVTGSAPEPTPVRDPIAAPVGGTVENAEARRAWWRDPWGGALVSIGSASLVTGAVLVGLAHREAGRASGAADDRGYGDHIERAQTRQIAGATVMSVGAALAVGGAVRWAVLARRGRERNVAIAPTLRGFVVWGRLPSLATARIAASTRRATGLAPSRSPPRSRWRRR
jgi:hypothetical protein